jgi:hypothetical protein
LEAIRKRKNNAGAGPVGKRTKISGKKKIAILKVAAAPKGMGVASTHMKATPKAAAQKAATMKDIPHVAQVVPKAVVLRISTRRKRPESTEPSSVQARKQVKVTKAMPSTPASDNKIAAPS